MAEVVLKGIGRSFGKTEVLRDIDLEIASGTFVAIVGPSGCGKSTLLRLIAGLEDVTTGTITIDGATVNRLAPAKRGVAMVFQSYALYPHMTVYENMAFGLKLKGATRQERDARIRETAAMLQISEFLDRLPRQLSGGQRQRVAIGRAIVRDPKVFLFDEPLSNLDAALRAATRLEIAKLHERMPHTTMIYVTHDQIEAMTLADRIVVLNKGCIEQTGAPLTLYERPANLFVARFIGTPAMNIVPCQIARREGEGTVQPAAGNAFHMRVQASLESGIAGSLGIRPEHLMLLEDSDNEDPDAPFFSGRVMLAEQLGEYQLVHTVVDGLEAPLTVKVTGSPPVARGQPVRLTARAQHVHLFDAAGTALPTAAASLED